MGAPSAIRVDNDFAPGQTSIPVWPSNGEGARGVDVVDSVLIQLLGRDNGLNDVFEEIGPDLLVGNVRRVLCGYQNCVYS